ncbi:MAG TPA: hypothetical protein VK541_24670 [Pedobacter sp.]|nr:hypothetical protein [Pedobacter sp.]HMI05705.1 hypothetical protein [Pedobacter sp.]
MIYNGKVVYHAKVRRNAGLIAQTAGRLDPDLIFSAMLMVRGNAVQAYG